MRKNRLLQGQPEPSEPGRHRCIEVLKRAARTAPCAGRYLQLRLVSNTAMR
jgi:hypothetical protein